MAEITCPECGGEVAIRDESAGVSMAECARCDVFFSTDVSAPSGSEPALPSRYACRFEAREASIVRRWYSPVAWFFVLFTVLVNAVIFIAFRFFLPDTNLFGWVLKTTLLLMNASAVLLCLAVFFNKTVIRLSQDRLTVSVGPVPWPGTKTVCREDVLRFYCRRHVVRGDMGEDVSYRVLAGLRSGGSENLSLAFSEREIALHFQRALQRLHENLAVAD